MAGVEGVLVQWAPGIPPLASLVEEDWVTLADWQSIKTSGGESIEDVTQTFNVGKATIRLRNGDSVGNTPVFLPTTSYKGRQIRVYDPTVVEFVFRGRIGRVEFHYQDSPFAGQVTLHCVDEVGAVMEGELPDELFPDTVDYFTQVADVETAFNTTIAQATLTAAVVGQFSHQLVKAPDKFETRQALLDFLNQVLLTEGAALFALTAGQPYEDALLLRGRWTPFDLLGSDAQPPLATFKDSLPVNIADSEVNYRRDDLGWSDADEDFVNSVQTRSKYVGDTFLQENIAAGYPRIQLSRTELVTIRQGWVDANGRMWKTLYNQARAYPKKLKFLVASRGSFQPTVFTLVGAAAGLPVFGRYFIVEHTPPGTALPIEYRVVVNSVEHDIDRQRWLCTLGFLSLDRWWFGYGNGVDPIDLVTIDGDADHGIDSAAIIAP